MLPITHQRVFHIPHSLATLAAIAALVTALTWDRADDGTDAVELRAAGESSVLSAGATTETVSEKAEQSAGSVECHRCSGSGLSNLLPLVLPGVSTR